jgi:FAD/FMN-containing dehydrogenase
VPGLIAALREIVGPEAVLARPEDLLVYEADGLTVHGAKPSAVVLPSDKTEVVRVVRACRAHGVPFVPRGAGTGLSGGAIALEDGVVIECSRLNRILRIDAENRIAVVEPGVVNAELTKAAAPHGLFFAPDPSSQLACTLGGNAAENSGGPHTLKYGTTTNHVLALELVLPDGEIVRLGSATGVAPGYDLVGAVVGSEGTLGIVTELTVRLSPQPERADTLLGIFGDVVSACRAVGAIIASGLVPAALEIVDKRTIAAVEASVYAAGLPTDAGAAFYGRARDILAELDDAASSAAGSGELSGLIRVAGPLSFGTLHLSPVLVDFLARHPRVELALHLNDRVVDIIHEGYDLAVRIGRLNSPRRCLTSRRCGP